MACLRSRATRWPGCTTPLSRACPPSPRKKHSSLAAGVPVLDLLHVSVRADGTPYEATRFVMRGDMSSLVYDAPIE